MQALFIVPLLPLLGFVVLALAGSAAADVVVEPTGRIYVNWHYNLSGVPDWDPRALDFTDEKEIYNWNADFVLLTMAVHQSSGRCSCHPASGYRVS